ncbi:hypothetical protein [Microbacterium abyssi]|uniref:hypothetical protein n=1 Tax=Microbacterium abyssi TaxID=2782166 RepID=UPI0018881F04|nr:hypothetical protein [Microbacterium sp. A18JL241]
MTSRRLRAGAVIAALLITAPLIVNAAPSPRPAGFCDSFLSFLCPKDDPAPGKTTTPPATDAPEVPGVVDELIPDAETPADPGEADSAPDETPVPAPVDDGAPIFTGTPASMRSGGLSFTGLQGISIVSVPTVDGGSVRALKISADSITISGFSLTVRPHDGPGLVTTADTMSLKGNVSVYLGSVSASSMGGEPLTLGTDTPPSLDLIEPGLLDVTMGLVGSTADSISYSNTDQNIVEADAG